MKRRLFFKPLHSRRAIALSVVMFMLLIFTGCSILPDGGGGGGGGGGDTPKDLTEKEVIQKALPSVVSIRVPTDEGFSQGSGVIYSADGYIITNDHVISEANTNSYQITFSNQRVLNAKLVGTDSRMDLAVLKVEADNLQAATFGDSSKVEKGDRVVVIGNAEGVKDTTTQGMISNVDVALPIGAIVKFLQTDAAVNHGNSGGALLNMRAEVIGINEIGLNSLDIDAMNFAIPSNDAKKIADQLIEKGYVSWPYLGVLVKAAKLNNKPCLYVSAVRSGSPADKTGLRKGDIINTANGVQVGSVADLREQINASGIGNMLSLDIIRGKQEGIVEVEHLEELPKAIKRDIDWS